MKYFLIVVLWITHDEIKAQNPRPVKNTPENTRISSANQRVQQLIDLCEQFRFSNPDSLRLIAQQLYDQGVQQKDPVVRAWGHLYLGVHHNLTGKNAEALQITQQHIPVIASLKGQSLLLGKLYGLGGLSLMKLNRQKEALNIFYDGLRLAENTHDTMGQVKCNNNIGWAFMELNQFEKAIGHFKQALAVIQANNLPDRYATIYNNIGSCYGSLGQYDSSAKYAQRGITVARQFNDMAALANGLNILGTFLTKQGRYEEALAAFLEAKPIREKAGDPWFIVSDLAQIADLQATLGDTAEGIRNCMAAIDLAEKHALTAKLPLIYAALVHNYEVAGNYKAAAAIYKRSNALKDTLYARADPAALAEIQTRYETEKKELQIQQQQFAISQRNYWISGIVAALLLGALLLFNWFRRSRLKQETMLQSEIIRQQQLSTKAVLEAEERERQRIAKDLHDGIGQILSAAKMNLSAIETELPFNGENQKAKFNTIIELVDESCREVRIVSHNMMPNVLLKVGLAAAVREFIDKVDNNVLKIKLYDEGLHDRLDTNVETILYRVIQECVNNVIKHAAATHLNISLIKDGDGISATIEDNGVGFDTLNGSRYKGIGLKNICTRIEYLKGTVDFDSRPGNGTLVAIHVPLL